MASTYVRGYLHMCGLMATEEILEAPTIMESNNYGFTIAEHADHALVPSLIALNVLWMREIITPPIAINAHCSPSRSPLASWFCRMQNDVNSLSCITLCPFHSLLCWWLVMFETSNCYLHSTHASATATTTMPSIQKALLCELFLICYNSSLLESRK